MGACCSDSQRANISTSAVCPGQTLTASRFVECGRIFAEEQCSSIGYYWNSSAGTCHSPETVCLDPQPCGEGTHWDIFDCTCKDDTPIIIDIAGNGFNLTNAQNGVNFDFNRDRTVDHIAWTVANSDDAFLCYDRSGNGRIDNGSELFGNYTPQPKPPIGKEKNGFLALAEYDKLSLGGNEDDQIDNRDSIFSSLRLWQDINHNGISEPTELHTLTELGIAILELKYKESRRVDEHGNRFRWRTKVKDVRGAQVGRWAWDVILMRQ